VSLDDDGPSRLDRRHLAQRLVAFDAELAQHADQRVPIRALLRAAFSDPSLESGVGGAHLDAKGPGADAPAGAEAGTTAGAPVRHPDEDHLPDLRPADLTGQDLATPIALDVERSNLFHVLLRFKCAREGTAGLTRPNRSG
jgi:hypothetical protein